MSVAQPPKWTDDKARELDRLLLQSKRPADEWEFLQTCVVTKNEANGKMEAFPTGERWGYLRYVVEARRKYRIFAMEKSRRVLATWLFCCLYLFDALTQPNHANWIVSKKLEDSAYILGAERILGVYERIPEEIWPAKPALEASGKWGESGYTHLTCPSTGSYIRAVASGADQLRSYTASNILLDEFAFQERQEECWQAVAPTILGGGHIDMVSTPELGTYMYDLIYDTGRA